MNRIKQINLAVYWNLLIIYTICSLNQCTNAQENQVEAELENADLLNANIDQVDASYLKKIFKTDPNLLVNSRRLLQLPLFNTMKNTFKTFNKIRQGIRESLKGTNKITEGFHGVNSKIPNMAS